jgi:hypothetical protein
LLGHWLAAKPQLFRTNPVHRRLGLYRQNHGLELELHHSPQKLGRTPLATPSPS